MKTKRKSEDPRAKLFRKIVKERDKVCQLHSVIDTCLVMEVHHIRGRNVGALEFDPANGLYVCRDCHRFCTDYPEAAAKEIQKAIGKERWEYLHLPKWSDGFHVPNPEQQLAELKDQVRRLKCQE